MMGWALTSSWKKDKFSKLIWLYLLCILVHGAWNFMAIAVSLNDLAVFASLSFHSVLKIVFPVLMVAMAIGMLFTMFRITKHLTADLQPPQYG